MFEQQISYLDLTELKPDPKPHLIYENLPGSIFWKGVPFETHKIHTIKGKMFD